MFYLDTVKSSVYTLHGIIYKNTVIDYNYWYIHIQLLIYKIAVWKFITYAETIC